MRSTYLPVALPWIGEEEKELVLETLETGWLTTGPRTKQFEVEFAESVGAKYALAVNSCTAALHIALAALGIGPGDEVIISNLTFACNANVVIQLGAKPVLVDVDRSTQLMLVDQVASKCNAKTKAIIPVHFAGFPAPLDELHSLASRLGIPIIEDAAHASGTLYRGKRVGSIEGTLATAFSFYAIKNMTTGEGGMLTSNDADFVERARLFSLHGMNRDAWKRYTAEGSWFYEIVVPGYKYNMTDMQASLGLAQLRKLPMFNERRRAISKVYDEAFGAMQGCIIPHDDPQHYSSRHLYTLLIEPQHVGMDRNKFIEQLKERNIGTTVHYVPLHMHPYYRDLYGFKPDDFPNSHWIYQRTITLPLYPKMSDQDVRDVVDAVQDVILSAKKA
jgi:dTDP-4-amino-4,6-dideoxygalactose transaminase